MNPTISGIQKCADLRYVRDYVPRWEGEQICEDLDLSGFFEVSALENPEVIN